MIRPLTLLLALLSAQAVIAKSNCISPNKGEKVSELYYQLCPKERDDTDIKVTPKEGLGEELNLRDMAKRRTQDNLFQKIPRKNNLFVPPAQRKNWWNQDGSLPGKKSSERRP